MIEHIVNPTPLESPEDCRKLIEALKPFYHDAYFRACEGPWQGLDVVVLETKTIIGDIVYDDADIKEYTDLLLGKIKHTEEE